MPRVTYQESSGELYPNSGNLAPLSELLPVLPGLPLSKIPFTDMPMETCKFLPSRFNACYTISSLPLITLNLKLYSQVFLDNIPLKILDVKILLLPIFVYDFLLLSLKKSM